MSLKKWVLTGGPCSGKTTLINELKQRGFITLDEIARKVFEERKGFALDATEMAERQRRILERQLDAERGLEGKYDYTDEHNDVVHDAFLDRGLVDCVAYAHTAFGFVPDDFYKVPLRMRYGGIFVLERFPFVNDGIRAEKDDAEAQKLHDSIINCYCAYGYRPVIVPRMGAAERADFILEHIKK